LAIKPKGPKGKAFARHGVEGHVGDRVRQFNRRANVATHLEAPARAGETVRRICDTSAWPPSPVPRRPTIWTANESLIRFCRRRGGSSALQKARIDALLYDRRLLLWLVNERFCGSLRVLSIALQELVVKATKRQQVGG